MATIAGVKWMDESTKFLCCPLQDAHDVYVLCVTLSKDGPIERPIGGWIRLPFQPITVASFDSVTRIRMAGTCKDMISDCILRLAGMFIFGGMEIIEVICVKL